MYYLVTLPGRHLVNSQLRASAMLLEVNVGQASISFQQSAQAIKPQVMAS